jgi:hypothetical protein
MTSSRSLHPRVPQGRSRIAGYELLAVQRATTLIDDLGTELDRKLRSEGRETERLRMLRETTNRITRAANDAIQAYGKARRALNAEVERGTGNVDAAIAMQARLRSARLDLLRALNSADRRYPSTDPLRADQPDAGSATRS